MNYTSWWEGELSTPESDHSLANLAATGANWVAIVVTGLQETHTSTAVRHDLPSVPTDEDLAHAIARAHELGLNVMLKPHVDLSDDPEHWRGNIGDGFTEEAQWQAWFASYGAFINHYATLAQENGVEQFCIGTELVGTSSREGNWREIVAGVRERFKGPITYASNHSGEEESITWWDSVDYIGVDAYYVLTEGTDPTVDELKAAWVERGYLDTLAHLAKTHDRPVLITEIGYRSVDGAIRTPWDWKSDTLDLQEQADGYRVALETLLDPPWLAGIYWWMWDVNPQTGGETDTGFTPHGKPAEEVLRAYYGRASEASAERMPTPTEQVTLRYASPPALRPAPTLHRGWTSYTNVSRANDLAFDGAGNLWIATPGGLVKWDMADDAYARYTVEHGLTGNWMETINVAPDGALWVGTDGGVSHLDEDTWVNYTAEDGLACNGVTSITVAPNGDAWIGTFGCGVSRFDRHTWTTYTEEDGLVERHVMCTAATPDGTLWFGTWRGVSRFDGTAWSAYTNAHGLADNHVRSIAVDPTGVLWFATWSGGVTRRNGTLWTSHGPADGVGSWVETIAVAPDGTAWAGTLSGVSGFDDAAWTWATHTIGGSLTDSQSGAVKPSDRRGPSIAFAPDGDVWIGSYDSGIYHFDGEAWTRYSFAGGPASNKVRSIAVAPDGAVWVGTAADRYGEGGGVSRFDGRAWTTYYTVADGLVSDDVSAIAVAPDGTLWVGTDTGISYFDGRVWTASNSPIDHHPTSIAIAPDGAVWAGTKGDGVFVFDGQAWANYTADDGPASNRVSGVAVTPDGEVWLGTKQGVSRFDGTSWTTYTAADGLAQDDIQSIGAASDGTVWIGAAGGVSRFDGTAWTTYIVNGNPQTIAVAPDGAVWVGTKGAGVFVFDGQAWTNYTTENGLTDNDVESIAVASDSTVWIGTDGGGASCYVPPD